MGLNDCLRSGVYPAASSDAVDVLAYFNNVASERPFLYYDRRHIINQFSVEKTCWKDIIMCRSSLVFICCKSSKRRERRRNVRNDGEREKIIEPVGRAVCAVCIRRRNYLLLFIE